MWMGKNIGTAAIPLILWALAAITGINIPNSH